MPRIERATGHDGRGQHPIRARSLWVDYVLPAMMHQRPLKAELESWRCGRAGIRHLRRSEAATVLCQSFCRGVRKDSARARLSDHYPVIGRFEYADEPGVSAHWPQRRRMNVRSALFRKGSLPLLPQRLSDRRTGAPDAEPILGSLRKLIPIDCRLCRHRVILRALRLSA